MLKLFELCLDVFVLLFKFVELLHRFLDRPVVVFHDGQFCCLSSLDFFLKTINLFDVVGLTRAWDINFIPPLIFALDNWQISL